jgi:hypothetical protein
MEKVFKIFGIVIPTLFMCHMVDNIFIARTEGGFVQYITIFTFSFAITAAISFLIWRIEKLEQKVKEMEQNLNNE